MLGVDGYELICRIRSLGPQGGSTPAIALTPYAKPVEFSEPVVVIASLAGRAGVGAANDS